MPGTPHLDKLNAALTNPKCAQDRALLEKAKGLYHDWVSQLDALGSTPSIPKWSGRLRKRSKRS